MLVAVTANSVASVIQVVVMAVVIVSIVVMTIVVKGLVVAVMGLNVVTVAAIVIVAVHAIVHAIVSLRLRQNRIKAGVHHRTAHWTDVHSTNNAVGIHKETAGNVDHAIGVGSRACINHNRKC